MDVEEGEEHGNKSVILLSLRQVGITSSSFWFCKQCPWIFLMLSDQVWQEVSSLPLSVYLHESSLVFVT